MVAKITSPVTPLEVIDKINEIVDDKQDTLVSGTNIKTINNTSILGSGNIDIQGGGSYTAGDGIDITNNVISVDGVTTSEVTLATVATTGAYSDLTGTPSLATVATSGDYDDLSNKPTIPTVNNATLTIQKNGTTVNTFTANASSDVTANITVPTKTSDLTNDDGFITGITSSDVTTALGYTPYNSSNPSGYQANVIETVKVNGTALTPTNKAVDITVPSAVTEATVSGWGFTKNTGTVTSVNNVSPVNGNVSLSIPTVNNATLTITQGGTSKGTFTANASSDVTIALDSGGGASRNIGEIVQSTIPLTDAGLHLLDGSLISGSGAYADFVTYIASLVSGNPDIFETEANWQTSVTNYGVCGKFVYDSVNNTVRLPKITGFTEGTIDPTVLGDLTEAGLPNITGTHNGTGSANWTSVDGTGAFSASTTSGTAGYSAGGYNLYKYLVDYKASNSDPIYGNSSTVQPQSIKVLYYIVIATSTKTQIEVDIDEIATDLNSKADVDLTNLSNGLANTICTTSATTTSSATNARPAVIVENYVNGTSWYRVYSDGWCEQGGRTTLNEISTATVTYLKEFSDTNYTVLAIQTTQSTANDSEVGIQFTPTSTTQGTLSCHYINPNTTDVSWEAKGYIS